MLTLQETIWQLARNKGRTLILVMASAMLAGCVAFYLGNIRANEEAIDRLSEETPVVVTVTDPGGDRDSMLDINAFRHDNFLTSPYLKDFYARIYCEGVYNPELRQSETAMADCSLGAVSSVENIWMSDGEFTYSDGYDDSMFQTNEPICLVSQDFAERNGIEVGDEVSMPIYSMSYEVGKNIIYTPLGEQTIKVVGTCFSRVDPWEFMVPASWIRGVMESQGIEVCYNELSAVLKDPRHLSVFKESIQGLNFMEAAPATYEDYTGAAIVVNDEEYITSAETMGQVVVLFRRFQVPFFALLIGMIILAIFLIMRGSRRVIAISVSLGRPRSLCALGCFLAAFIAELIGCVLVLPVMVLAAGISISGGLMICGAFLLCACAGNIVALLLLLRFNAFTLLTAVE